MEKVAIFDLDGTLINGDSTIEFIDYFLRKQKSKKNYIKFLINRVTNYFIPLSGIRNNYRYRCIKLLKGYNLESITLTAIEFVELFLSKIINDNILEQANKLKKQGFVTIILSGSIDIVVDAFARRYGFIQSKGSSLKFDAHNICEGVFERDISNSKIDIIKSLSNRIDFANSYSFTDNKVDSMWLKYFGHAYGVVNSYIDSDFWQQNNLNVLYKIPALRIKKEYLYWPLEYYWYTRLRLADYIPSFIIDYIILPIILITNQGFSLNIFYFISILISFLIFYSAYEIGYITNDQHAYKETKPTYRVPQWPSIFINKLILIRIIYILIGLNLIRLFGYNSVSIYICLIVLGVTYYIHNHVNSRLKLKIITEFLLRILRIIGPITPFMNHSNIHDILFMMIYIILSRCIFWLLPLYRYKYRYRSETTIKDNYYILVRSILEIIISIFWFEVFKRLEVVNTTNFKIYLLIFIDLTIYPAIRIIKHSYSLYKNSYRNKLFSYNKTF